jgi:hypothetical protein
MKFHDPACGRDIALRAEVGVSSSHRHVGPDSQPFSHLHTQLCGLQHQLARRRGCFSRRDWLQHGDSTRLRRHRPQLCSDRGDTRAAGRQGRSIQLHRAVVFHLPDQIAALRNLADALAGFETFGAQGGRLTRHQIQIDGRDPDFVDFQGVRDPHEQSLRRADIAEGGVQYRFPGVDTYDATVAHSDGGRSLSHDFERHLPGDIGRLFVHRNSLRPPVR